MKDIFEKLRILWLLLADTCESWHKEVWKTDLDAQFCCDGRECGCGGATVRDIYDSVYPTGEESR